MLEEPGYMVLGFVIIVGGITLLLGIGGLVCLAIETSREEERQFQERRQAIARRRENTNKSPFSPGAKAVQHRRNCAIPKLRQNR